MTLAESPHSAQEHPDTDCVENGAARQRGRDDDDKTMVQRCADVLRRCCNEVQDLRETDVKRLSALKGVLDEAFEEAVRSLVAKKEIEVRTLADSTRIFNRGTSVD